MTDDAAAAARGCPSCGAPRQGRFCAACGERFITHEDLQITHYFTQHLPHEMLHVDGKLPATLRALFLHPGAFAADYIAGRRRPYLDPLRLYVVTYIVYIFLSSFAAQHVPLPEFAASTDPTGITASLLAARPQIDWQNALLEQKLEARRHFFGEFGTMLVVFLLAAVQLVLFRPYHRRYLEHLALALNVATFAVCLAAAAGLIGALLRLAHVRAPVDTVMEVVNLVLIPLYWFAAIRRFYGAGVPAAVGLAIAMLAVNVLIATAIMIAVLAILIVTA